jgi:hypothetical protein
MSIRDPRDAALPGGTAGSATSGRHAGSASPRHRRVRALLVVLLLAAAALPGTAAYAWWSGSGSGSGSASAGTLEALVISGDAATPTSQLLPGQTGSVTLLVHNPNAFPVRLVAVTRVVSSEISVSGASGCTIANSGISFTDQTGLSISVPTGVDWQEIQLPDAVSMAASSDDACQGAAFGIPVQLTVRTP